MSNTFDAQIHCCALMAYKKMITPPPASSGDLAFARSISRRLRRSDEVGRRESSVCEAPRYAYFDASRIINEDSPKGSIDMATSESFGADAWNQLLDRCIAASHGHSALLIDRHGLLVAHRGRLGVQDMEMLGARLSVTVEHAAKMDQLTKIISAVCIERQSDWFSGLRFTLGDESVLVLGVVSESPLVGSLKASVEELLVSAGAVRPPGIA